MSTEAKPELYEDAYDALEAEELSATAITPDERALLKDREGNPLSEAEAIATVTSWRARKRANTARLAELNIGRR